LKEDYRGTRPDVRHSLYWRTEQTTPAGPDDIHFMTSDIKGTYQLKVYAVAADGKLHVEEKLFTVL
jgi:hypothetical protein